MYEKAVYEKVVGVRFKKETLDKLRKASDSLGITMVSFIRMAVRKELARLGYITGEEAKALKDGEGEQ